MTCTYEVSSEETGMRIDKLLKIQLANYSRQQIQQWLKDGLVLVHEQPVKANYKCREADVITWTIPEEKSLVLEAEDIPLDIIHEDDFLLVLHKPKGMLVHPTNIVQSGTLVNALLHHGCPLSSLNGEDRPGIVHRLDQDTSGLLVVAKDDQTHAALKEQFQDQKVTRVYEAITEGVLPHVQGTIQAPIGRNPKQRQQMAVTDHGKPAETQFHVLQHYPAHTHVSCKLITGRTHQIRVHMQYLGHPIVGDPVYGRRKSIYQDGQALFARQLGFLHPENGEEMMFTIDRPAYFQEILEKLQTSS